MLSDLSNRLEISTIKDAVTDIYHTMHDKLNKVKEVFLKDPEILPMKEPVKDEGYVDPPAPTPTPTTPMEIASATFINIWNYLKDYGLKFAMVIIYIYLASLVANDMIIYAAPIRAVFFVFTLFFSITFLPYAVLVGLYYLILKGYDLYNYYLSSVDPKPSKSFPMIFAILPLTTYYSDSPFVRFLLWTFAYQKSPTIPGRLEKENRRLEEVMTKYWNDLNSSFEYIAKIEKTPPFSTFRGIIKKNLSREIMHPIQIPGYENYVLPPVQPQQPQQPQQAQQQQQQAQQQPQQPQQAQQQPQQAQQQPQQAQQAQQQQQQQQGDAPSPPKYN
jgi:hypothetical protein